MDQKILWDCHMHSSFSADSDTPMEEMIQTAADQGLTGICFTEHFDPDYPDTPENLDFSLNIKNIAFDINMDKRHEFVAELEIINSGAVSADYSRILHGLYSLNQSSRVYPETLSNLTVRTLAGDAEFFYYSRIQFI